MAWPIFDEIFPRFKEAILANPRTEPLSQLQSTLKEFEKKDQPIVPRAMEWQRGCRVMPGRTKGTTFVTKSNEWRSVACIVGAV
jgi:hypothetical protein